jgi:hypothetical protein
MGNMVDWAKEEMAFLLDGDEMNKAMYDHLLHMVEEFAAEGHSGFSAAYAANALNKLFRFQPLRPLQGTDDEWNEIGDGVFQNKRCSRVFKQADRFEGQAYDIEGIVFREPSGACFTSSDSFKPVTFPYVPNTEYKDVVPEDFEEKDPKV